jgi:hypothetical protein
MEESISSKEEKIPSIPIHASSLNPSDSILKIPPIPNHPSSVDDRSSIRLQQYLKGRTEYENKGLIGMYIRTKTPERLYNDVDH